MYLKLLTQLTMKTAPNIFRTINLLSLFISFFLFSNDQLKAQCTSSFTHAPDPVNSCTIDFTNTSMNYSSCKWYFGDGGFSTQASPSHTYFTAGNYNVKLYTYDNTGNFCDSAVQTINVSCGSGSICNASFQHTFVTGSSCDVIFTASGASSYTWDFGDGNIGLGQNPTHTYMLNGTYNVCMLAYDASGFICDTVCQPVLITGCNVSCNLSLSDSVIMPSCASLCDGSAEVFVSGGSAPYIINWSNGATTFTATNLCCGSYLVTVIDNVGCLDTITVDVPCNPLIVNANVVDESYVGANDAEITVNVTGGTPAYIYSIDGGVTSQSSNIFSGLSAGVYVITVTDVNGCTSMYTVVITIVSNCIANFTYATDSIDSCIINFQNNSTGASYFYWEFGDGGASNQNNPSHTYTMSGAYPVSLYAYDSLGNICDSINIFVSVNCGVPCNFTINDSLADPTGCNLCNGYISVSANGGTPPYTYMWSNGQTTSYLDQLCAGTYIVTVTDSTGCISTATYTLTSSSAPTVTATATDESFCGANDGTITVQVTGGTPPYQYSIDMGTSYQSSNVFTGLWSGTHVINVIDSNGCTGIYTVLISCIPLTCDADFNAYPDSVNGCMVYFVNNSTGLLTYMWDFGDGGPTSTLTDPTYTYSASGTYSVSLYAYDSLGNICDSLTQSITVNCGGSSIKDISFIKGLNIYPNPFKEMIYIDFSIEYKMQVELLITDLLGKQIEVRDLGELNAGMHQLSWRNNHLSKGVYLLHLNTPNGRITKKVISER